MKIEKKYADSKYYGSKRTLKDIMYIVVQDIKNGKTPHYHIINNTAIQIIPDYYMSNSINGGRFNKNGYLHGICTEYNSVSIGVPEKMSEEDKQLCLNLVMTLKQRYKIIDDRIVRQMDITGEINPAEWHNNDKWVKDIKNKLIDI